MSVAFTISMVLMAKDMISPGMREIVKNTTALKASLTSLNSVPFLDKQINKLTEFNKKLDEVKKKAQELRTGGLENIAAGAAVLTPVQMALKQAGDFQSVQKDLKIATYDSSVPEAVRQATVNALSGLSLQLGKDSIFNGTEVGSAIAELARSNIDTKDILGGAGKATIDLAQAGGIDPVTSALAMSKIGNSFGLRGSQYNQLADYMARLDGASTAKIETLMSGYKYAASYASAVKMSYQNTGLALAVLNNRGLDDTTAGTGLANVLAKLTPNTKPATQAMQQLHLLNKDGTSKFFDDKGKAKDLLTIVNQLRTATKGMRDDAKLSLLRDMFEDEGARAMLLLMQEGKGSIEEVNAAISKQMSLQDRVAEQMTGLNGQIEQMKGSWETFLATAGQPILSDATNTVQWIGNVLDKTSQWAEKNKEVAGTILRVTTYLGVALATLGGIKLAASAVMYAWQGFKILTKPVEWVARGTRWAAGKFRKSPLQEAAEAVGKSASASGAGTMIVRAGRVYITGHLGGLSAGSAGGKGTILGPDGNPLNKEGSVKRKFKYGNKPNIPDIPSTKEWKSPVLDDIKNASKLAKVGKIAGIAGTVVSTGMAAYDLYKQAQQTGWKDAISNNGGSIAGNALGGLVGGAVGTLAGPLGTAAGAYLGSTVGDKIGTWLDSSGVTKRIVNSVSDTISAIKGWWNGGDAQKAKQDMDGVQKSVATNTNLMGQSLSSLQQESNGWGSGMMNGLAAGITAGLPGVMSSISLIKSYMQSTMSLQPSLSGPSIPPNYTAPKPAFIGPPAPPRYLGGNSNNIQVVNRNQFNVYGPNPEETARLVDKKISTPDKYLQSRYPLGGRNVE